MSVENPPKSANRSQRTSMAALETTKASRTASCWDWSSSFGSAIGHDAAVHMVVQTDRGPVTVFYVVGRHEATRAVWQRNGVVGRSVPMADGTLLLLADYDDRFDALERDWTQALDGASGEALAQL